MIQRRYELSDEQWSPTNSIARYFIYASVPHSLEGYNDDVLRRGGKSF